MGPPVVTGYVGGLVSLVSHWSNVARPCFMWRLLAAEAADCRTPRGPRDSAGSWVDGVRVQKTLVILSTD